MNSIFNRVLIFDGSYALHRALAEPHNWEMRNSKGKRTGGIFGVLRTITKELKTYNYYPVVVFDGGLSKRRLELYPNYKRAEEKALLTESLEEKTEEQLLDEEFRREYSTQRNDLMELLPLFGIPVIRINDWEGDDLIYIISKLTHNSIVVSDDKDLIQLLRDPQTSNEGRYCSIRRPLRDEFLKIEDLKEKNMNVKDFVHCKAIVGDVSDNIPSACFQVGEKTAPGLCQLYENVLKNNLKFPSNEKELTELCKKFNIAKRKAYLNFNENQFLTNLLLTDLNLVDNDITDDLVHSIYIDIFEQYKEQNKQNILDILEELNIKTFDTDYLLSRVNNLKDFLPIEKYEETQGIKLINQKSVGLFD